MEILKINLPIDFISGLDRRHNGTPHTQEEIKSTEKLLRNNYKILQEYRKKLEHLLNIEWEERDIEGHYGEPIFYGAHRRLRRYEKIIKEKHKVMFALLTHFDGNYNQEFSEFGVISPDDIMNDFKRKYLKGE